MSQGDTKVFNDYVLKEKQGAYSVNDDWRISFVTNTYEQINTNLTNPTIGDVDITSGGNVHNEYSLSSKSLSRVDEVITFDAGDIGTISASTSNPNDIRCAILYNATVSNDLAQVWDCTDDGVTPININLNNLKLNFGAAGINQAINSSA